MTDRGRVYIAIDLKSFYASVECIERGLDPMTTHLVVADESRTEKTICLAVSPSLKEYGISGRARLFEVVQKVREINRTRRRYAPGGEFSGSSYDANELKRSPALSLSYVIAPPQMAHYMEVSAEIYRVYLKYISPEDIHVYSIDEVFIDATDYLTLYRLTPRELAMKMILDVLSATGITATAGIGTNLFLCKVAMDIGAKRIQPDKNGVRIAALDEMRYRRFLWTHRPLTDFWRIGPGYAKKLEANGMYTMGDVARRSLSAQGELQLYRLFGIQAELLIDHAWGWEPCSMADIKAYKPETNSIGSGQVLPSPYSFEKAKLVIREMADQLSLDLVDKELMTDQLVLTVGYDSENLTDLSIRESYRGEVATDRYGRRMPKQAHGTVGLKQYTSSTSVIVQAVSELFDRIVDKSLLIRRMYITANRVLNEAAVPQNMAYRQLDLFTDYTAEEKKEEAERSAREKERSMQKALLSIKKKHGKNAILRGMNLEEGATARDRNGKIGGHKA